jgi:hypothetical protein
MGTFQERFANGIYRDCRFCGGRGCLACKAQADADYKSEFPDGPKPLATFRLDDPKDAELAKDLIGMKGLIKALRDAGKT